MEEKRQNYTNYLEELKSKTNEIKAKNLKNNEYSIILLDECIKFLDENFIIFSLTKEILSTFNVLNDKAQNIIYTINKMNNSVEYYEEIYKKLNK